MGSMGLWDHGIVGSWELTFCVSFGWIMDGENVDYDLVLLQDMSM